MEDQPKLPLAASSKALPSHSGTERANENDRRIAERITTLLSHFWTADEDPRLRKLQIADWLDDLAEFGPGIVSRAVKEWRQTETKRPTPADIRKLCIAEQCEPAGQIAGPQQSRNYGMIIMPGLTPEEYAQAKADKEHRLELARQWQEANPPAPMGGFKRLGPNDPPPRHETDLTPLSQEARDRLNARFEQPETDPAL